MKLFPGNLIPSLLMLVTVALVQAGSIQPYFVLSGSRSEIKKADYVRVVSEKEWDALWHRHAPESNQCPAVLQKPRVNFDKCMVIAVFAGETCCSQGFSYASSFEQTDSIILRIINLTYQIESQFPDENTKVYPHVFIILPRSHKAIVIEVRTDNLIPPGKTPKWSELHRFPPIREKN